jgi:short-subunit dehydrogenase
MKHVEKNAGKVIVITGASAGIGADLLDVFHEKGFRVVGMARRRDRLDAHCARLNQSPSKSPGGQNVTALAVECDVSKDASLEAGFQEVMRVFGRIDGVVANAGFGVAGLADGLTLADYRRQLDTNLFGVLGAFMAAKSELKKNSGFFGVVGSVNSYLSIPTASAYAMSKFAVRAFTEALYWEMKPLNVGVTLVCPGFVKTEIRQVNNEGVFKERSKDPVPEWLMMPSREAAEKTARACLNRRKELILTLHGKVGIWLQRHFPWIMIPAHKSLAGSGVDSRWNEKPQS